MDMCILQGSGVLTIFRKIMTLWTFAFSLKFAYIDHVLSTTPPTFLYRFFWNFIYWKITICTCAYCKEFGFEQFFAKLWPFELWRFHWNLHTLTIFCPQLLLHFYIDSFETLYTGRLLYEHVHIARKWGLNNFSQNFDPLNFGVFTEICVYWPCSVHNSSYFSR